MDYIKIAGILVLMSWICQVGTIPIIPIAPVYPGTTSTTTANAITNTSYTRTSTTTEAAFKPITPIIRTLSKNFTNSSSSFQGRSVIGASDLLFDEDVQKILDSATEETPKRISNGYDDDETDDDENDYEPEQRPYKRRRPYGLLSAMADKLYGVPSEPQSYITYANPYSSLVKKRRGRPRNKYYQYRKYGLKPYTEHYKFYNPYSGGYKRPPKRYSSDYYGLPIGGVYKDPWYNGMYRRPGRPFRDYDRYTDYRRHSKPPKFHKWKDHKEGDQQQSGGHIVETYDDDDNKHEVIEHEPAPPHPPKNGYQKVMGPPPPEIMEKINKLYKKPCYMPHCEHYKKGFIKFSYKKIVFPKKVKIIPIKSKKPKAKPIIVYQPAPKPVTEHYPTNYSPAPDLSDYHTHSVEFQVPYGVTGFEYTPSYPTKVVEPYIPEFSKAPVQEISYQPNYIPTDYGSDVHGASYDGGKQGSYSQPVANVEKPSHNIPTSGYDSSSLQQYYPSNTYNYEGNHGLSASGGASYGSTSYGSDSSYGATSNSGDGTSYGDGGGTSYGDGGGTSYGDDGGTSDGDRGGTSYGGGGGTSYGGGGGTSYGGGGGTSYGGGGGTSYGGGGGTSYGGSPDYRSGPYNVKSTTTNEVNSLKESNGGKVYFKPLKDNSNGKPSNSIASQYSASTAHESYILRPSSWQTLGKGYVKELEPKPMSSYHKKKFNALKSFYSDEAKYDKGPPKDPYGPTYMPDHDPAESYPYERSDKGKNQKKKNNRVYNVS